jgi:hypothetical protein
MLLVAAGPAVGQTVSVTVPPTLYEFSTDAEIAVEVQLDGAGPLAGVDLVMTYPADRFLAVPTWENGDLFGLVSVNAESMPGQVVVAAAAAEALGVSQGTLVTLTFLVPCEGNDVEGGVDLTFSFAEFRPWDESAQALTASAPDATVTLSCTPVATGAVSFGMVKAFFDSNEGR